MKWLQVLASIVTTASAASTNKDYFLKKLKEKHPDLGRKVSGYNYNDKTGELILQTALSISDFSQALDDISSSPEEYGLEHIVLAWTSDNVAHAKPVLAWAQSLDDVDLSKRDDVHVTKPFNHELTKAKTI